MWFRRIVVHVLIVPAVATHPRQNSTMREKLGLSYSAPGLTQSRGRLGEPGFVEENPGLQSLQIVIEFAAS